MRRCNESECASLWLDPAPHPDHLERVYETYYTHAPAGRFPLAYWAYRRLARAWLATELGYGTSPLAAIAALAFNEARREELRYAVLYLRAPAGRACDVGCGEGSRLERLAELGWHAVGVEPDPRSARIARSRGLDVREGILASSCLLDRSFDAVTMAHVIEHVPDPIQTLRETRRLLAPGGRLAVATPNAVSLGARRWGESWRGLEPPRHLQVFTPASLLAVTRQAGYDTARVRTSARMAAFIHLASETGRTGGGNTALSRGLRLAAADFARTERDALTADPLAGEEIVLEAQI